MASKQLIARLEKYNLHFIDPKDTRILQAIELLFDKGCPQPEIKNEIYKFYLGVYYAYDSIRNECAISYFNGLVNSENKDLSMGALQHLARIYTAQGKTDMAEKCYLRLINMENYSILPALARLYRDIQNYEQAIKYYTQAMKQQEHSDCFHYQIGLCLELQGKTDEAVKSYLEAIRYGSVAAHVKLGDIYYRRKESGDAEYHFLEAIKRGLFACTLSLGKLYRDQGQYDDAVKYLVMGIDLCVGECREELNALIRERAADDTAWFIAILCTHKQYLDATNTAKLDYILSVVKVVAQ